MPQSQIPSVPDPTRPASPGADQVLLVGDEALAALLPAHLTLRTAEGLAEALATLSDVAVRLVVHAPERITASEAAVLVRAAGTVPVVLLLPPGQEALAPALLGAGASECLPRAGLTAGRLEEGLLRSEARAAYLRWLRSREALYRTLVERDIDATVTFDASLTITSASERTGRILGWEPGELLGHKAVEFVTPEGQPKLADAVAWTLAHPGVPFSSLSEVRHKDGHTVPVEGTLINLLDEPGVGALAAVFRDSTQRAERLRLIEESEGRFRSIAEDTPVPLWLEDQDRNLIYENKTALEFVGRSFEEEAGEGWLDAVHPDDLERVRQHYAQSLHERRDLTLEFRMRRHDGQWRDTLQISIPRWDDRGRFLGFLGVDIDVTDIKAKAARTEAAEERYRLFVEQSTEGIWRFEIETPISVSLPAEEQVDLMVARSVLAECNLAMARMYGYDDPSELVGAPLRALLDPTDPRNREYLLAFVRSGYRLIDAESHEMDREGRPKIFLNNLIGIVEDGQLTRSWGLQRDITERTQLEEEARQSRKMEATGRLAGGIAHDFNNLLTAILGTTEILLQDLPAGSPHAADVEEIKRAAVRAANLTRQLLAFSRRQVLQPKVLDLDHLVRGIESLLRRLIGEDVHLLTRTEPGLWRVKADPGQLEQVILNLCVNARDAMPTGGTIEVTSRNLVVDEPPHGAASIIPRGRYVLLTVSDTGSGMDEQTLRHIFEPFFTTKGPGKGTGLGLATVYGIVKQSGGFIFADSAAGEGSRFRIYLPRAEGEVDVADTSEGALEVRGRGTILLVEDEEAVRRLARRVLSGAGYEIIEAANGLDALRAVEARSGKFDLVVTDIIMPGMSGQQLSARLRERQPDLRVLYVSGYSDEAILPHGRLLPNTAFLQKPFSPPVLLARVREVLEG